MSRPLDGWGALFTSAFAQSRNPMALVDARRTVIEVNAAFVALVGRHRDEMLGRPLWTLVAGGPLLTPAEWEHSVLRERRATGAADMLRADGPPVSVQWAATPTLLGSRRVVLFVALSTNRWGRHFRRDAAKDDPGSLTRRERQIVTLVAHGKTGREIADELHISHETVRTHLRNAMRKRGARSRAHLVAQAVSGGLLLHVDHPSEVTTSTRATATVAT